MEDGCDILDVGGMSTRPGALEVSEEEETARVVDVIRGVRAHCPSLPISIDTYRSGVSASAV